MTVTWTLRDGLKWSDGQPLTCDDFKYAQEWVLDKDNTGLFAGRSGYEDDQQVRLPVGHATMVLALPEDLRGLHHA